MLPTVIGSADLAATPAYQTAELLTAFFSGRSPHTIAAYRADLGDFAAFVRANTVEAAAGRLLAQSNGAANGMALAWRSHLVGLGRSPATINRRLSALRAVVALARTLGLITWGLDIKNLRAEAYRDTRGPERKGVQALLAAAETQAERRKAARDVALIRLLHDTALRRGEVCGLDLADIDMASGRVLVLGKGKSQKTAITLPEPTKAAVAAWIAERGTEAGPLFLAVDRWAGRTPKRLTGAGLWHVIKTLGVSAGMTARPHGLRHAAITSALDATQGNVRAVQRFSRHADVRTLQVYDDNREDLGGKVAAMIAA
jgi:integrase/recombinase XerC